MKNEKVENQKMEDVYNKEYLPSIVRVGRFVLLASTLFFFAPFLYTWMGGHTGLAGYRKGHFCLAAD